MILVRFRGGLGNQMFQYAAGRFLSLKYNRELVFDTSAYVIDWLRYFELGGLRVSGRHVNFLKAAAERNDSFMVNNSESFFKDLSNFPKILLDGFWQSPVYFESIKDKLREEFSITEPLDDEDNALAAEIANTNSVAVHVRRGDYLTVPASNAQWSALGLDYYQRAVDLLSTSIQEPVFYVFSDSPEWSRKNLKIEGRAIFVRSKYKFKHSTLERSWYVRRMYWLLGLKHILKSKNYLDFYLMSLCNHFIIANSTFSWWGAWIGGGDDKMVIAPRSWFLAKQADEQANQLLPTSWIRL